MLDTGTVKLRWGTRPIQATEGVNFSGYTAAFVQTSLPGLVSSYTATVNWGDGQTSAA